MSKRTSCVPGAEHRRGRTRPRLLVPAIMLAVAMIAVGVASAGGSPKSVFKITDLMHDLARVDVAASRVAWPQAPADYVQAIAAVRKIRDEAGGLAVKAKHARPSSAKGDEALIWEAFLEVIELRVDAMQAWVDGLTQRRPKAEVYAAIDTVNEKVARAGNLFNGALARFRGEAAPVPLACDGLAQLDLIDGQHDRLNAFDTTVGQQRAGATRAGNRQLFIRLERVFIVGYDRLATDIASGLAALSPSAELRDGWLLLADLVKARRSGEAALLKAVLAGDAKAVLASYTAAGKAVGAVNDRWTAFAIESNRRYAKCR